MFKTASEPPDPGSGVLQFSVSLRPQQVSRSPLFNGVERHSPCLYRTIRPILMYSAKYSRMTPDPARANMENDVRPHLSPGTPSHANMVKTGKATSVWREGVQDESMTRNAWQNGSTVRGRPNVRDFEVGEPIGFEPRGGTQSRVRVHGDSKGRIHGHTSGPEVPR